ncbi:hypothetical protein COO60DRAFT_578244 [Scenedesmus sp. NREL 46B-D3]|nr:hypothetical protein COO60DRAFT_578244 [Scenedesmus sp. NREL 46B-D3]
MHLQGIPSSNGVGLQHHQQQQQLAAGLLSRASSSASSPSHHSTRARQQQQQQWVHGNSNTSSKLSGEAVLQLQRSLQQLQQELAAAVQERDAAQEQLYQAVRRADAAAATLQDAERWKQGQLELERKLEVALEIIGERSIRIEELEADIADMKSIFHDQLEEAVGQVQAMKQQLAAGS